MAGTDERTPDQKNAEGYSALEQLLGRTGLFAWGPVVQAVVPALTEAVAEKTATGAVSKATAKRAAAAIEKALAGGE